VVLEELPFARLVGGCVRDALLGYPPKDLDIEVYQTDPDDLVKTLERAGKVDQVGKSFGVIKLTLDGQIFDFSLPRRDRKLPEGGHKPNSEILESSSSSSSCASSVHWDSVDRKETDILQLMGRVARG
jgi:tRNA nucleotidyltransferase (CCA-adding enzyme)